MSVLYLGFPDGSDGKESTCIAGDLGSIPGPGRSTGDRQCNPFQYSFLENSMGRGPWWVTVHGVTKSRTQLSTRTHTSIKINVPSVLATKSESFFFSFLSGV